MGIPLRTLIIEDSADDTLLMVRLLQKGGYDLTYEWVETAEAMGEALERETWDIIISDYKMPCFNGLAALKLYKEKGLDIPFIIVSGTIGEEAATTVMVSGAHDYVMKNNLPRLVPAIQRELKDAESRKERKQAEEALVFNNIILRTQQESSIDGILVVDKKGEILSFNQPFVDLWDIPPDVIESKSAERTLQSAMNKLASPEEFNRKVKHLYEVRDEINRDEVFLKDGRSLDLYSAPMLGAGGKYYGRVWYFRDITERKQAEENLKQAAKKLRKSLVGTIQAMSLMVETRDPYTAGHQRRVSRLARALAQEMGLPEDTIDTIRMAGVIHDIGKISVPAEILAKPGKITDTEMNLIKVHAQSGYDILSEVELPYPIAEIVLQHHERLDGSGYPQGIKNGQILLESRIIAVADVVEAAASHRPYRPARGIDAALEEIERHKGILYDEKVVEVCIKLFREKKFGFEEGGTFPSPPM